MLNVKVKGNKKKKNTRRFCHQFMEKLKVSKIKINFVVRWSHTVLLLCTVFGSVSFKVML